MKLTLTTLVIIEDTSDNCNEISLCYHSFQEDPNNEDQGYESGISMYGHYIACKCLDISSEREYMNQYTDIRILTNELEPC